MSNVLSGKIGLLTDETDGIGNDRSIVREIYGSLVTDKALKADCYNDADPTPTLANSPNVALTDFYGHSQANYGTVEARDTSSYTGTAYIYGSDTSQYALTGSFVTWWNATEPTSDLGTIRVYKNSSQGSFQEADQVALDCFRRTKGSGLFTRYQTLDPYTSGVVSLVLESYDYRFDLIDVVP
jgi:hypothetical protein